LSPSVSIYFSLLFSTFHFGVVGNGVGHVNEIQLRRAKLVQESLTTFGGSVIPVFIQATQAHSARPSLCGYWRWCRPLLGKKRRVLRSSGPCYQDC